MSDHEPLVVNHKASIFGSRDEDREGRNWDSFTDDNETRNGSVTESNLRQNSSNAASIFRQTKETRDVWDAESTVRPTNEEPRDTSNLASIFRPQNEGRDVFAYSRDELMSFSKSDLVEIYFEATERGKEAEKISKNIPRPTLPRSMIVPDRRQPSWESNDGSEFEVIAKGGFGVVYSAKSSLDKKTYAVKTVLVTANAAIEVAPNSRNVRREIQILRALPTHINIVGYIQSYVVHNPDSTLFQEIEGAQAHAKIKLMYVINTEFCEEGDLKGYLSPDCAVQDEKSLHARLITSLALFLGCIDGLRIVHSRRIMHRDLKPANILLARDAEDVLTAKLGDFGLSCRFDEFRPRSYTLYFSSPEQFNHGEQGASSDIYSLGMVLLAVIMDVPEASIVERKREELTFDHESLKKTFVEKWALNDLEERDPTWKDELFNLCKTLVEPDAGLRPDLGEARLHYADLYNRLDDFLEGIEA